MNQVVINYGDDVTRPVKVEWSLKDDNNVELLPDIPSHYLDTEVLTIPYSLRNYTKLFAKVLRYYDDGNGGLTVPDTVGPISVLNPKSGTYDNARVNDPIYKPTIETYIDGDNIIVKLLPIQTLFNISALGHITISIVDISGVNVLYKFNIIPPVNNIISIPVSDLSTSIPHGIFNVSVMYHNDLHEASKFNMSELTIGDTGIVITSNREDLSIQPVQPLSFNIVDSSLNLTLVQLVANDDSILYTQSFDNVNSNGIFIIPKSTMSVNTPYTIRFTTDTKVINIGISTRSSENIYIKQAFNYNYETSQVNVGLDIVPGFNIESMSDYCITYNKNSTLTPMLDNSIFVHVSDEMDNISGVLNSTTISMVESLDAFNTLIDNMIQYLTNNPYKNNLYKPFIKRLHEYTTQYRESVYVTTLNQDQYTTASENITNLIALQKMLEDYTYNLPVTRLLSSSSESGLVAFNDITNGVFSTVSIRYDSMIVDTIDKLGKRMLTLIRLDTISFVNDTLYSIEVPNSVKVELDGSNDIVYNPSDGLVYINNIILVDGVTKTELLSFNPKTKVFTVCPTRTGLPNGDYPNYKDNTLTYIGNGLILSVGSTSDDTYINKTAFIFDSVTNTWDNISDISITFTNKKLFNIPLINGDVLFIPKERTNNNCMIFRYDLMNFVYKDMDFGNVARDIIGIIRTHTPHPILVTEEIGYSIN